jgi:hypothetical protein
MNSALIADSNQTIQQQLEQSKNALNAGDSLTRSEMLEEVLSSARRTEEMVERDFRAAHAQLERNDALAKNALDADQRTRLAVTLQEQTDNERIREVLKPELIQAMANEVRCPGKSQLKNIEESSAIQRAKGVLAEAMAAADARSEIERENKTRGADRQLFLIEGDRIRDEQGKKMSDGLIAWRDSENKLQIWKALEVKSGPHAARDLNEVIEKLTKKQDEELRKSALDAAREEAEKLQGLTEAQRQSETERLRKEIEAYLRSPAGQRESGQQERTTERLDLAERIYIDGQAHEMEIDKERRLKDIVQKVATEESLKQDQELRRLEARADELEQVARAFFEELIKKNKN